LNRNGHYQTVIRLYTKNELNYETTFSSKHAEKLRQQYLYALDSVDSLRRSAGGLGDGSKDSVQNLIAEKSIEFVKKLLYVLLFGIIASLILRNVRLNVVFKLRFIV
jgi:hypothetical protein